MHSFLINLFFELSNKPYKMLGNLLLMTYSLKHACYAMERQFLNLESHLFPLSHLNEYSSNVLYCTIVLLWYVTVCLYIRGQWESM